MVIAPISAERIANLASVTAATVIAQLVMAKAVRDALFLSVFPAPALPFAMVASALLALIVVVALSRAIARWSPDRMVPSLLVGNAALFAASWALSHIAPSAGAVVVYLHTSSTGAAVVSALWSLVNERFDPHTARRMVGRITAGATAGGVGGGIAVWRLADAVSLTDLLLVCAFANLIAAVIAHLAADPTPRGSGPGESLASGLRSLEQTPYLRHLLLLVALGALGEAAVDYVFKATASAHYASAADLASFFALFHMFVGVATFALQASLARLILEKLGLASTLGSLPAVQASCGLAALAAPGLLSVTLLRGARAALESSLFRSGYELLYTPLAPAQKRSTKALIDVGGDKIGGALGAGVAALAVTAAPGASAHLLLALAVVTGAAGLVLTLHLQRGYVRALADSLRSGAIDLDEAKLLDATTRRAFADTLALDRDKLMVEIAARRAAQRTRAPTSPEDTTAQVRRELASGDPERITRALREASPLPAALVALVMPLLARDDLLAVVVSALREVAPRATGQLIDALLDPETDFVARRRLPRVIRAANDQRAVDGLLAGLRDERFEVRHRCGVALLDLTTSVRGLHVDRQAVLAAAQGEVARGLHEARPALLDPSDDEASPFAAEAVLQAHGRTLSHVFTLLSLVLEREPLQLAYRALASEDPGLRGTGLEYLENVLPDDLLAQLRPVLGDRQATQRERRQRDELARELLASRASLDLDALTDDDAE